MKNTLILLLLLFHFFSYSQPVKEYFPTGGNTTKIEEKNKIVCLTCDTLILNSGKPQIIAYKINKRNISNQNFPQPTDIELRNNMYKFSKIMDREIFELKNNFQNADLHKIYRNTYIKIKNDDNEIINFLDLENFYEGIIYWDGKSKSKIIRNDNIILSSELFSKQSGENIISSYINEFANVEQEISKLLTPSTPTKALIEKTNLFLINTFFDDNFLPTPFLSFNKVKEISIEIEPDKKLIFIFNELNQLVNYNTQITKCEIQYKNGIPVLNKTTINEDQILKKIILYSKKIPFL